MTARRGMAAFCCAVLLCLLLFTSCSANHRLVGRWETVLEDDQLGRVSVIYHFTEDGKIYLEQRQGDAIPFSLPFGTFSATGDQVTIEADGERNIYTFSVTEGTLLLQAEGEEELLFLRV